MLHRRPHVQLLNDNARSESRTFARPGGGALSRLVESANSSTLGVVDGRGGKVLLVDDEPQIRRLVGYVLQRSAEEVALAEDGQQAIDLFSSGTRFDAVICDIVMPRLNGLDVLRWLDENLPKMVPHLVFVTGGAAPEIERHLAHRPIFYKPLNRAAITSALRVALRGRESPSPAYSASVQAAPSAPSTRAAPTSAND